ncbi:hypothetical protein C1O66_10560 [Paucibacter aquatile]|uniref:Uncharacterized protein n=1 Tax=Kinneretia aquatilis TaxID=2070761 RepID=A0A2N8KWU7_9BURK|nr:hypothetical protein [Paucibacter aquatile]PND37925.1 hypothetical protein C1O66_10560 [Paucibacter aquatile]
MQPSSSLTKFAIKPATPVAPAVAAPAASDPHAAAELKGRGRGKNKRVGIAVRLGHEDWYRLHDLAVREHTSLQALIVAGLSAVMEQRGLPPLSGS